MEARQRVPYEIRLTYADVKLNIAVMSRDKCSLSNGMHVDEESKRKCREFKDLPIIDFNQINPRIKQLLPMDHLVLEFNVKMTLT
jgi:hypothetical protein